MGFFVCLFVYDLVWFLFPFCKAVVSSSVLREYTGVESLLCRYSQRTGGIQTALIVTIAGAVVV